MKKNIIADKSYSFAVRIVKLSQFLAKERKEYVLSKQVLRSGTSIGANSREAIGGQSQKDFFAKLTISYKEARETEYWICLLKDTGYISEKEFISLKKDSVEIIKILTSIQKTLKAKIGN